MSDDRYFVMDATKIVNCQQALFEEFQKECRFVAFQDLYELIVLVFYIPPIETLGAYETSYEKAKSYYMHDREKIESSSVFDVLIENIYLSIVNYVSDYLYTVVDIDQYNPDIDILLAVRFISPFSLLIKCTRDKTAYVS